MTKWKEKCNDTLKNEVLAMNSHEIEQNVKRIIEHFSKENFLLAYGIYKTSGDSGVSTLSTQQTFKQ